jgi:tetratricopeptide (TPR) repeat protein
MMPTSSDPAVDTRVSVPSELQPDPLVELAARLVKTLPTLKDATLRADLHTRLGLLCWDVLSDLEAASKYLVEAGASNPEAVRLRLHLAISTGDQKALRELQSEVGTALTDRTAAVHFHRICAETWLLHFGDMEASIRAAREALRRDTNDAETRSTLALALELSGNLDELVKQLRLAPVTDVPAHRRLATLLADVHGRVDEAGKLLRRVRKPEVFDPYLGERLWELVIADGMTKPANKELAISLLSQKVQALASAPDPEELGAARFLWMLLLQENPDGDLDAAAEPLLGELAAPGGTWGPRLALEWQRIRYARRRDHARLAEVYQELTARAGSAALKGAYLFRGAELVEAVGDKARAVELYLQVIQVDPTQREAVFAAERLLYQLERSSQLIELYEAAAARIPELAPRLLSRAAHMAESRLKDAAEACRLRRPSIEVKPDLDSLGELARSFRRGRDLKSLQRVYAQTLALLREIPAETRRAALYAAAAGAVALARGGVAEADKLFDEALQIVPEDRFSHQALLGIYRRAEKWRELVGAIQRELKFDPVKEEQARLQTEIGRIALERLADNALAERSLLAAANLSSDDPTLHHLLSQVYDAKKDYAKAITLRRRAVEGFGASFRSAVLLGEIGDIYAQKLHDDAKAEEAYKEALDRDDELDTALESLGILYRRRGRFDDLAQNIARRLDFAADPAAASRLQLELADVAEKNLKQPERALEAFRSALALDPGNSGALDGLERICRREGRWQLLAETLEPLAAEPAARRLLLDALERLERWDQVRRLLESDLATATTPEVVATLASRLADIHELRLGRAEAALPFARRAAESQPRDLARLERYRALAERVGPGTDLSGIYERFLEILPAGDPQRVDLFRKYGAFLIGQTGRMADATRVLEEGLRTAPEDRELLDLLAQAYEAQDRSEDLLAILKIRARVAADAQDQVTVLLRAGKLHESKNEFESALETYLGAFRLNPANRETFTMVERLCFRLKLWREVMEVYDRAIELVEQSQSRAYRLADLYARRGQLQLQYLSQTGEAAASYLKVLELDPGGDTALKFLESIFSKEGDWAGLIAAYEKRAALLDDLPKKVETLRRAARVAAAKLKDADVAARHYEAIHLLAPDDAESLDALERYFERSRSWDKLVAVLQARLKQLAPAEMVPLYLRIGTIYEEGLRNVEEAINNYKKVLEISGGHRESLEALSRIYEATEKWAEFIDITRRQIRITQDRAAKALLYFKCGSVMEAKFAKTEDAIRYYDAAIKTSAGCLPAVHGLRDLYIRREEWPKVLETLELEVKLWQEVKERAGVYARMGHIYQVNLGELDKAIQYFESALSVDPECMPAIRSLFDIAFQRGDWDRAANLSQTLSQKALREGEPAERSDFYLKRGQVAFHAGSAAQAAENYVAALEIRPENLAALDALIELCRDQPTITDFATTFKALEKVYGRRDWPQAQARVLLARGTMLEQAGTVDPAIASYREAVNLAPNDLAVLRPLVDILLRLRRPDEALAELEGLAGRLPPEAPEAFDALLRAADILSNVIRDSRRASATLRVILKRQPRHREALFLHAQELFVQGRTADARIVCDRLIEVAVDPKHTAPPADLGRYYYYLGFLQAAEGDEKSASTAFRRALELSPGFPPAAIALARRHAKRDAMPQAEALLTGAARTALERGQTAEALLLRRHLAELQVQAGNPAAGLAEMRGVVSTGNAGPEDRVALAQMYALEETLRPRAVDELRAVIEARPDHLQAVRLLGDLYPMSDGVGRLRVLRALKVLGAARPEETQAIVQADSLALPVLGQLTDDLRGRHLAVEEVRGPLGRIWQAVHEHLERLYPVQAAPEGLRPWNPITDGADPAEVAHALCFDGAPFQVLVAERSPRPVWIALESPPKIVILQSLVTGHRAESRFLIARALEYLRSGFSLLCRIGPRERTELGLLFKAMCKPEDQREPSATEFMGLLSRPQIKAVERVTQAAGDVIPSLDVLAWTRGIDILMSKVGLLVGDDLDAACRSLARMGSVEQAIRPDGRMVIRALVGGQNLLRFYLSSNYYELHSAMTAPRAPAAAG